jgi:hypothetical protein
MTLASLPCELSNGHAVQLRPTALPGHDPATRVCRQMATQVNWTELLLVRLRRHVGRRSRNEIPSAAA